MPEGLRPLPAVFVERVWGSRNLSPLYPPQKRTIGEVWFQTDPPLPLLIKFIFTTAALSVQVHPNDQQARAAGLPNGKTEMWHILRAEPGATIALGFERECTREEVRTACLDGSVEQLLHYETAVLGATYFTRANTVHALGPGLTLVEIQQHSDTTYRLYDYGRPRELHLDEGLAVADLRPWRAEAPNRTSVAPWITLAACEYFHTERAAINELYRWAGGAERFSLLIPVEGSGHFGDQSVSAGQVWLAAGASAFDIVPDGLLHLLRVRP